MSDSIFYDGNRLLNTLDINGKKPEIFICTSNRSAGKTTYFNRYLTNRFIKYGEKFSLIYRYRYELDGVADKFFKDIQGIFFKNYTMEDETRMKGLYKDLYLNGEHCGYAISLNSADQLKKNSHLFSDTKVMLFDEFMPETGNYCSKETTKFQSIHKSIARGSGQQRRYLPVIMISNPVTLVNPYYLQFGIADRLRADTKILKGNGWVLEQGFNESAAKSGLDMGFDRAFADSDYQNYAKQGVYLLDSTAFIEQPKGVSRYVCTLKYEGNEYGVREYADTGVMYVSDKVDSSYRIKITVTTEDHQINYVMLQRNDYMLNMFRRYFEQGVFRFKNQACKEALIRSLSFTN